MNIFTKLRLASYRKKAIDKESAAKYYHIIEPEIIRLFQTLHSMVDADCPFQQIEPIQNDYSTYVELGDYLRKKARIKKSDTEWGRLKSQSDAESNKEIERSKRLLKMLNSKDENIRRKAAREMDAEERRELRARYGSPDNWPKEYDYLKWS